MHVPASIDCSLTFEIVCCAGPHSGFLGPGKAGPPAHPAEGNVRAPTCLAWRPGPW